MNERLRKRRRIAEYPEKEMERLRRKEVEEKDEKGGMSKKEKQ